MKKEHVSIPLCTVWKSVSWDFILFPFQVKFTNKAGFDPGVAQLKSIYLNELWTYLGSVIISDYDDGLTKNVLIICTFYLIFGLKLSL